MDNQAKNLSTTVKTWLENQRYPLEMSVASEFYKHGFSVKQSSYYIYPETGKSREIDVMAAKSLFTGNYSAKIRFVVECKASKKKPWVIFSRENEIHPRFTTLSSAKNKQ
jgi:hypothetical protein